MKAYPSFDRIAKTESGLLRGVAGNTPQYTVFKGVPYAKPPMGGLRWKEPQPMEPWEGVRDASRFSSIAPQHSNFMGTLYGDEFFRCAEPISEDCLYLNIWTPAVTHDEKLPVLFWVHGGALMGGYGFEPEFDGEAFCREGIILVTINYRLGILGFYNHPELSAESPRHISGNYGHLDQVAALKWVKRNIANFGGDPDNITIFGQSAGAASVQMLWVSPLTKDDISGIIVMSSASIDKLQHIMTPQPMAELEKKGVEFMEAAGCANISELRGLSYERLEAVVAAAGGGFPPKYAFSSVIDNYFLEKSPSDCYFSGGFRDIPLMVGNTQGEGRGFFGPIPEVEDWKAAQRQMLGEYAAKFIEVADVHTKEDLERVAAENHGMMINNRVLCELNARHKHQPCYLYVFDHDLPGSEDGSFHSSELWYVFGTVSRCWRPMTGIDYDISRQMVKAWANFAKQHDPNGEGVPEWKPYNPENPCNMVFSEKSACRPIAETAIQKFLKETTLEM